MKRAMVILLALIATAAAANLPVVFWHGLGDSCCDRRSIGRLMDEIVAVDPSIFVHSIAIKPDASADQGASFFGSVNEQVDAVCAQLADMPQLSKGFNAIGVSQGGLFLRAYIERCNSPPVRTLVTLGSPHGGVVAPPGCDPSANQQRILDRQRIHKASSGLAFTSTSTNCALMRVILKTSVYSSWAQSNVVPAQYFKDPTRIDEYLARSSFLADINNDRTDSQNHTYATHLSSIKRLVLVRFLNDTTVIPRDTAWFSFQDESGTLLPLRDQPIYKEDRIGLQSLDRNGRIDFVSFPGKHLQLPDDVFVEQIVKKYLISS